MLMSASETISIPDAFEAATHHYQEGALPKAEELCRKVLVVEPDHADAWHLLGLIALAVGKNDAAVELVAKATSYQPQNPAYLNNLGVACLRSGRLEEAVGHLRQSLAILEAHPEAHNNLGRVLQAQGDPEAAEHHYRRALVLRPGYLEVLVALGGLQQGLGKLNECVSCYRQVLAIQPDNSEVLFTLANVLNEQGQEAEAMELYRRAVAVRPDFAEAHFNLACHLHRQGIIEQAVAHYQQAVALRPDLFEAYNSLGLLLQSLGRYEEADAYLRQVLELCPDYPDPYNNLGGLLKNQGLFQEALVLLRRAVSLQPDFFKAHDNLLMTLLYDAKTEAAEIEEAHREWGRQVAARITPGKVRWHNNPDPDRPLRIGFVSGDFRVHVVAFFLEDVFEALDPREVVLFCYSNNVVKDEMTERLRGMAAGWRDIAGLSDGEAARLIREDEIDILVDLAGHSAHNSLLVFALRAAPVQVTWLGYPDTTGLATVDYRITDAIVDPPGGSGWHSEELIHLPEGFLCYGTPQAAPEPSAPPCVDHGVTTFGCFNNNCKISPPVIALWAEILSRVPGSRLLLKNDALRSPAVRELWQKRFSAHNVPLGRLELVPWVNSLYDHMGLYNRMDVALDVFPYNGTTTTCDALWMGVSVVALRGERHVGRVGASLLTRVGLEELIAETPEEYVAKAVALANDRERLVGWRRDLRERMRGSALGDARRFARTLEHAFRDMWQKWLRETDHASDGSVDS